MFIVFFVCRFLCIYKKKEMRRKMFIKNIVYKKWYIIFCVYIIFDILCKNTNLSQRPKFFESQNFLHFFYFFLFQSAYKTQKFLFFDKFQSVLIKIQANTGQKAQKTKKLHKKREQPPSGRQKAQKSV